MSLADNNGPARARRRRRFPAWMAKSCAAAALGAGLVLTTSAQAALLGVSLVPPTVICAGGPVLAVVNYNATTDLLSVDGIPVGADPARAGIPSGPPAACELDVTVDAGGNPGGGTLLVRDGNNNIVVTGTLVPGAFAFLNAGTTDRFDFIFTATGGDLVPIGDAVGVDLTSFNTGGGFNGSFQQSFTGEAKPMVVGAIPPGIDLEKHTGSVSGFANGADVDDPNDGAAPAIATGNTVHWTYKVTNTGGQTLSDVVVVDDHGTPADPSDDLCTINAVCANPGAIACPSDQLAPGEMMICTASDAALNLDNPPVGLTPVPGLCAGVANRPLYENRAEATGESEDGTIVDDEDPSHYCNLAASPQAALLGVSLVPPTIICAGGPVLAVVNYNATTDLLSVDGIPVGADPARAGIPSGPPASCEIDVTVDASGNPGGGTLLIRDGDSNIVVTGTLVPGAFGFLNAGTTDKFDFIFTATGGDLVPVGDAVGVLLTSYNSGGGFNGSFATSFTGQATPMDVGALPPDTPHSISYGFDANGRLDGASSTTGETLQYQYDANGNIILRAGQ